MYNKELNCRFKHAGRQGRSKNKLRFPRHIINRYEGTHLSMRPKETWPEYRCPWPNMKHVKGLINKFIGKPYSKFLKVWHAKLEHVDARIKSTFDLKRVIDPEQIQHKYYSIKYYIDDNGLIQKYKENRSHKYRYELTKHQRKYNDSVKIPNLGVCRRIDREDYEWARNHSKLNPIRLGEFYVCLDKVTIKIPIYTCCSNLMLKYYRAQDISEFIKDRDFKLEEKKRTLTEIWVPIKTSPWFGNPISRNLQGQYIYVDVPNKYRESAIRDYSVAVSTCDNERAEALKAKIETMPKTNKLNVGYGAFYLFVKRKDIEKAKDT